MNLRLLMLGALCGVLVLGGCTSAADKLAEKQAYDQLVLVGTAKLVAAKQLRDPSSAQFTNVSVSPDGNKVCGEINGKNGFGGYAGSTRFTYSRSRATLESVVRDDPLHKMKLCVLNAEYRACKGEELPGVGAIACIKASHAPQ